MEDNAIDWSSVYGDESNYDSTGYIGPGSSPMANDTVTITSPASAQSSASSSPSWLDTVKNIFGVAQQGADVATKILQATNESKAQGTATQQQIAQQRAVGQAAQATAQKQQAFAKYLPWVIGGVFIIGLLIVLPNFRKRK